MTLQLRFESKPLQFGQTDFLGVDTNRVVSHLGVIERYLHDVLKEAWERRAWTIHAGTDVTLVSDALQDLFRADTFRANMTNPVAEMTRLINAHMFGEATKATQEALESLVRIGAAAEAKDPHREGDKISDSG
jgi:hypothetical protein